MRCHAFLLTALGLLVAACGGESEGDVASGEVVQYDSAEIAEYQALADDYVAIFIGSWPDIDRALDRWSDDMVLNDPSNGDESLSGSEAAPFWAEFARVVGDVNYEIERTFIGSDGFAYVASSDLWPRDEPVPAGHRTIEMGRLEFEGDNVVYFDLWFNYDTLAAVGFGCVVDDQCDHIDVVDNYITAWTSGDKQAIAELYAADAVFTDTLNGLAATGPDDIVRIADNRFASGGLDLTVVEVYALTNTPDAPTPDEPERGQLLGVAIQYDVEYAGAPGPTSITLLEMGTRTPSGATPEPSGLITRETVYHDSSSLSIPSDD